MAETINATLADIARRLGAELNAPLPNSRRILWATGTVAVGLWRPGDPVELVCCSDNTAEKFWAVFEEAFDLPEDSAQGFVRTVSNTDITRVLGPGRITIRYCPFRPNLRYPRHRWHTYETFKVRMGLDGERGRNMVWDAVSISAYLEKSPEREAFDEVYNILHAWFTTHGLLHQPSGYLNSQGLLYLLFEVFKRWHEEKFNGMAPDAPAFLKYFAEHILDQLEVDGLGLGGPGPTAWVGECGDLVDNITPSAVQVTRDALETLANSTSVLEAALGVFPREAYQTWVTNAFANAHLLAFSMESYSIKTSELYYVIDQLPSKLVEYMKPNRSLQYRIWPHPIVQANLQDGSGVHVTYLMAIERPEPGAAAYGFRIGVRDLLSDAVDDLAHEAPDGVFYSLTTVDDPQPFLANERAPQLLATLDFSSVKAPALTQVRSAHDPARPFRSADKAISKAQYDPAYAHTEFEVGYIDRFKGLLWMDLGKWGCEYVEEEEFIPAHRVQKLRRTADGVVVWDREERKDLL